MSREQGNIWPIISVAGAAVLVLVVVPLAIQRQRGSRLATVDAQVTIGDAGSGLSVGESRSQYRWPDSEVPRTAERLRDVTAVAIAASTSVIEGSLRGKIPRDAKELVAYIAQRQLVPAEWQTSESGVLQTPRGTIHLRYSPKELMVEVISAPRDRSDGPAILIRLPDLESTRVGARYFESMQLDGIVYPAPFAP
ncbi:MAG TPA: hypothetical protein VHQ94_12805, partial [Pyrinomonadaceae bacterium]|nr:hypothetical protein [Pyrinomonadaceae bacterium]